MKLGLSIRGAALVFTLAVSMLPLWGQAGTGSVQGTVRDVSGAVIPGAAVTLTGTQTNVAMHTSATGAGLFMFPGVIPGTYSLSAEAPGMQQFEGRLTLQTEQRAVVDVTLQVGEIATQVSVKDVTPLVTSDVPTLGHVLERERIDQLPMGARGPNQYIVTVPGVIKPAYGRAYGLHTGAIDTLVDGASTAERVYGEWNPTVNIDAVQEIAVETNNSSAKFSRPVNMVISTRSGTNQFHGALDEIHVNSAFGSARERQEYWSKAPQQINNSFGASAGGPVVLPRVYNGRNRTFWFVAYNGARTVSPKSVGYTVPTEAMRRGDFSGLTDAQGRRITLYDPWTTDTRTWARQPFSHGGRLNVIDPARLSPVAKYMFAVAPMPTEPNVNPLVAPNLWAKFPQNANSDNITMRVDHQISANDRIFVRYTRGSQTNVPNTSTTIGHLVTEPNIGRQTISSSNPNISISHTHVFSPSLFNELLLTGMLRPWHRNHGAPEDYPALLGLPNPFNANQFPSFGQTGLSGMNVPSGAIQFHNQGNVKVSDNATKIHGRHELQFGGSIRYEQLNVLPATNGKAGGVTFNTLATSLYDPKSSPSNPLAVPQTGNNVANMFLGAANYSAEFLRHTNYFRDNEYALYFQDNYKVTPRLTINLGLRWEYFTEYTEKDRNWVSFDRERKAVVLGAELDRFYAAKNSLPSVVGRFQELGVNFMTYREAGLPQNLVDPNRHNIGPRLGFAWRLGDGKRAAVLRGGYRGSYSRMGLSVWLTPVQNNIPMRAKFSNARLTSAAQSPDGFANYGMRSAPEIIAGVNSRNAIDLQDTSALTRGSAGMVYFNRSQPEMQVKDWNLTLEKEILPEIVARAAYLGNHASNLPSFYYFNEAPPAHVWFATTGLPLPTGEYANVAMRPYDQQVYGGMREYGRMGWSNCQGLLLEMERRFSRGVGFQVFYNLNNVLAAIDPAEAQVSAAASIPELNQFLPGTVPEDLKERLRFLNYQRDATFPKHSVSWNWIADLPFGKGKPLGRNAGGVLNQIVGGWQLAGMGTLSSNYFALPTNIFPTGEPIELYGYRYPIQDCRSGACQPGYLWWNGYIPPHQINSVDAAGRPNGVMGVPDGYKPAGQPLIPFPAAPVPNDPMAPYYGTNTVWVPMKNGAPQRTTYNTGLHPWQNQSAPGIREWSLAAALYKRFQITERVAARLNITFLNVLNHPGNPNAIGGDGVLDTQTSGQGARRLQARLQITW